MKKQRLKILFLIAAMLLAFYPPYRAQAKVCDFSNLYMEITAPEDTIVLTKDTPNTDELWSKAGINDPKAEKDNMSKLGSQAILYDPETGTAVNLLQKQSNKSRDVFNLSLLNEDQTQEFLNGLITPEDENTEIKVEKYPQQEIPFFRVSIEMTKDNALVQEIIYGTVVNGSTISLDIYNQNSKGTLDESFIKELVAGTHFTKYLDKAEVERQAQIARIYFIVSVAAIIAFTVIWLIIRKNRRKKQAALKKRKLELLEQFYKDQKLREEQQNKEAVLYVNKTRYTEDIIKNFYYYNEIFKRWKQWLVTAIMLVILFLIFYQPSQAFLSYFIGAAVLGVLIYFQATQTEKLIKNTIKGYGVDLKKDVIITFYEDYFSVSGTQYGSVFPYVQVMEVREHSDFIYVYLSNNKVFYLKKEGFEQGAGEFRKFIEQRVYLK